MCYGKSVSVWPSAPFMRMEKRFWDNRADYDTQINIIYPTTVCPTCSSRHPDGVVTCIECSTRLEPHTDQSMITEYMREREDAVRKNRQANPMLLAPSTGINRNRQRVRFEGLDEQRESISAARALRNKCKQMVKRADQRGLNNLVDIVENPIDAYNTSRVGLSVSSLAELWQHTRTSAFQTSASGQREEPASTARTRCEAGLRVATQHAESRPSDEVSCFLPGPVLQARRDRHSDLRGHKVELGPRLPHFGLRRQRSAVRR